MGDESNTIFVTPFLPIIYCHEKSDPSADSFNFQQDFTDIGYNFYYIRKSIHKEMKFPWIGCLVMEDDGSLR